MKLLLTIATFALCASSARAEFANPKLAVDAGWLRAHARDADVVVVDARTSEAFNTWHIPGARSLPIDETFDRSQPRNFPDTKEKLEALFTRKGLGNARHVVVYDAGADTAAARLFWTLDYLGHERVSVLDGGLKAWLAAGGETTTAPARDAPAAFVAKVDPAKMATRASCTTALGDRRFAVLDARSADEYTGKMKRSRRGGHMPGAINVEWKENFSKGSTVLKGADALAALYAGRGITRDKEVIAHCQGGHRSAVSYWVLRMLGYPKVGNYVGSWAEWGNASETPVVLGI